MFLAPFVVAPLRSIRRASPGSSDARSTAHGIPGDARQCRSRGDGGGHRLRDERRPAGRRPIRSPLSSSAQDRRQRGVSAALSSRPGQPLFFDGRRQDLAFEKPSRRERFDPSSLCASGRRSKPGDDGRPVWLGAATFDDGLGVSHYTGQITPSRRAGHRRRADLLLADLAAAKKVAATYWVSGVGPTPRSAETATATCYFTDGEIAFARLCAGLRSAGGRAGGACAPPRRIAAKNAVFCVARRVRRRLLR